MRGEIDVEPGYLQTSLQMDIELWFSDLSNELGGPTQWKQNYKKYSTQAKF
jgi:hypothetical protein